MSDETIVEIVENICATVFLIVFLFCIYRKGAK